jgi:hypothetical protein
MKHFWRSPTIFITSLLVLLSLTACNVGETTTIESNDDDQSTDECSADEVEECECSEDERGYQECVDGSFDNQCICEDEEDPDEDPENLCGGTSELTYDGEPLDALGGECGPCADGEISCDGEDQVQCSGASSADACLATGSVEITGYHDSWEYWEGDQELSVFFLEDFNQTCHQALDELDDGAVLRPIDSETNVENPIEVSAQNIPVGIEYTAVVVLHAEHSGFPWPPRWAARPWSSPQKMRSPI